MLPVPIFSSQWMFLYASKLESSELIRKWNVWSNFADFLLWEVWAFSFLREGFSGTPSLYLLVCVALRVGLLGIHKPYGPGLHTPYAKQNLSIFFFSFHTQDQHYLDATYTSMVYIYGGIMPYKNSWFLQQWRVK